MMENQFIQLSGGVHAKRSDTGSAGTSTSQEPCASCASAVQSATDASVRLGGVLKRSTLKAPAVLVGEAAGPSLFGQDTRLTPNADLTTSEQSTAPLVDPAFIQELMANTFVANVRMAGQDSGAPASLRANIVQFLASRFPATILPPPFGPIPEDLWWPWWMQAGSELGHTADTDGVSQVWYRKMTNGWMGGDDTFWRRIWNLIEAPTYEILPAMPPRHLRSTQPGECELDRLAKLQISKLGEVLVYQLDQTNVPENQRDTEQVATWLGILAFRELFVYVLSTSLDPAQIVKNVCRNDFRCTTPCHPICDIHAAYLNLRTYGTVTKPVGGHQSVFSMRPSKENPNIIEYFMKYMYTLESVVRLRCVEGEDF